MLRLKHRHVTVFEQEVPDVLRPINGVQYTDEKLDSIVNVAFEELRLLRKKHDYRKENERSHP